MCEDLELVQTWKRFRISSVSKGVMGTGRSKGGCSLFIIGPLETMYSLSNLMEGGDATGGRIRAYDELSMRGLFNRMTLAEQRRNGFTT